MTAWPVQAQTQGDDYPAAKRRITPSNLHASMLRDEQRHPAWEPLGPSAPDGRPPGADAPKTGAQPWDEHHGLFGPVRWGPVVGTGVPNVLSFGVTAKLWGYAGLGFNYGMIPDMQLSFYGHATVRYREYDAYARIYPFKGGFFFGVGMGRHSVQGTIVNDFQAPLPSGNVPYTLTSTGSVQSTIVTPQIGYFRNFDFGLALGVDVGAQIPVAAGNITFDSGVPPAVPAQYVAPAEQQVVDTLKTVGKTPIPAVNLRVGWLF